MEARELRLVGRVQGVGFRPFVKRLAGVHGLAGWVRNDAGAVSVFAQGHSAALDAFARDLVMKAPPLARPRLQDSRCARAEPLPRGGQAFSILHSNEGDAGEAQLPPDSFACDDCLAEMRDGQARRHGYPFINCTQCGPRYTIITRLPYDRPNTSMAGFPLCAACRAEYEDPLDRRHHAQPLACADCGPVLAYHGKEDAGAPRGGASAGAAVAATVAALGRGEVIAVKGIGGYHLICDARSPAAVMRLRRNKPRPHKPLAVMVRQEGADGLDEARRLAVVDAAAAAALADPMRPIVLLPRRVRDPRADAALAAEIAPNLVDLGLMLPYSPLHHLLLETWGGPLVATSGNVSGEPVITDASDAERRLSGMVDGFLHHDRPILRPADDSVCRIIAGRPRPIRLGRGIAPLHLDLPVAVPEPMLAVGGQMKVTVALAWGDRAVVSPHVGDLGSVRSAQVFEQVIGDLQSLYGVRAARVVCDAHPAYGSRRWAQRSGLPVTRVFHHFAHASALAGEQGGEQGLPGPSLIFTWDGVGYGPDGTLWGGEALLGGPGRWRRVASFRAFRIAGGDRIGREPWRSAAAVCWEAGRPSPFGDALAHHAWKRGLNTVRSSAVGRLFDAAAALSGLVEVASFEGQGPMWLEAASHAEGEPVPLPLTMDDDGVLRSDWAPLLAVLQDGRRTVGERAAAFHASLAAALLRQACSVRRRTGVRRVGLTGGVFQNRLLTERATALLHDAGFAVLLPERVPCNDAGISFGQVVEATMARPPP